MKRNQANLELYKEACKKVIERANNMCEVMVDQSGKACTNKPKHRCSKYIIDSEITYTNFLHTETRNGKSDNWIINPNNIIFGCKEHHYEEERTGIRVKSVEYDENELIYLTEYED